MTKHTILVVEDEPIIRMLAVELLEDAGFDVVECTNAADAMAFCQKQENNTATVFTDINMPGDFDGLDVARLATETRQGAAVVVTSGRYDLKPANLSPGVKFLPKPWTASSLLAAVDRPHCRSGNARPYSDTGWAPNVDA